LNDLGGIHGYFSFLIQPAVGRFKGYYMEFLMILGGSRSGCLGIFICLKVISPLIGLILYNHHTTLLLFRYTIMQIRMQNLCGRYLPPLLERCMFTDPASVAVFLIGL
jgi:hypothetical protein